SPYLNNSTSLNETFKPVLIKPFAQGALLVRAQGKADAPIHQDRLFPYKYLPRLPTSLPNKPQPFPLATLLNEPPLLGRLDFVTEPSTSHDQIVMLEVSQTQHPATAALVD